MAWTGDAGVLRLPAAPVKVAEYLTGLAGEPVFPRCGRRGSFCPRVTSGSQNTGCANRVFNVRRPFPVCESLPRTTLMQGLSRAATKIKVDAELSARMSDPPGLLL